MDQMNAASLQCGLELQIHTDHWGKTPQDSKPEHKFSLFSRIKIFVAVRLILIYIYKTMFLTFKLWFKVIKTEFESVKKWHSVCALYF